MATSEEQEGLICVDAAYNEVDCDDASAAFRVTPEEAKERAAAIKKAAEVPSTAPAEPAEPAEAAPVEEKAVEAAPKNKAVTASQKQNK